MDASACPVKIHKVTEDDAPAMKCPVNHKESQTKATTGQEADEINEFPEYPSYAEYKKIKRTMNMITNFYRNGSEMKKSNVDAMDSEIAKLDADKVFHFPCILINNIQNMAEMQLEALDLKPHFKAHPKKKDYRRDLTEELEGLNKQRVSFLEKRKDFENLYEWSKGIVKICEWYITDTS